MLTLEKYPNGSPGEERRIDNRNAATVLEHDDLRPTSFPYRRHQETPSAETPSAGEQHELKYRVTHLQKRFHCFVSRAINGEGGEARTCTQRIHARVALDVPLAAPNRLRGAK